jgi:hypothetical protein
MQADVIGATVGVIGILIGIVVSYYFYKKSLRVKEPCWAIRSNNLIEGYSATLDNLQVLYKDNIIQNLTISKILFWNNGKETIEHKDTETINHLRIGGEEGVRFLDAKILTNNNESSQCKVELVDTGDSIYLNFDYLDHKQGCVVQVVHTGTSSRDISILGDIKGVTSLRKKVSIPKWYAIFEYPMNLVKRYRKVLILFPMVTSIMYIIIGFMILLIPPIKIFTTSTPKSLALLDRIITAVFFCISGGMLFVMSISSWRRYSFVPKGLEIFHGE